MDERTAGKLAKATWEFYAQHARSFSQTRERPWPGWERLLKEGFLDPAPGCGPVSLLDAGCGNLRFERFLLAERVPFRALCLDACPALFEEGLASPAGAALDRACEFRELDLASAPDPLPGGAEGYRLAVAFGILHHVPGAKRRGRLVRALAGALRPDGALALSLWDLSGDDRVARKALRDTQRAVSELGLSGLGRGDYVLGWQDAPGAFRFCHSFDEREVDRLVADAEPLLQLVARFRSDGAGGTSNTYLVFRPKISGETGGCSAILA